MSRPQRSSTSSGCHFPVTYRLAPAIFNVILRQQQHTSRRNRGTGETLLQGAFLCKYSGLLVPVLRSRITALFCWANLLLAIWRVWKSNKLHKYATKQFASQLWEAVTKAIINVKPFNFLSEFFFFFLAYNCPILDWVLSGPCRHFSLMLIKFHIKSV